MSGAMFWPLARAEDEIFDRVDEALTFATTDGGWRGRISGTLELEAYDFQQPAPALIEATGRQLFNPRFVTFLDVQAGAAVYAFTQLRVDRGFDPAADPLRGRLDEYALRVTPWRDGRLSVQAGKFAAVFGNWISRHGAWENPFVSAPLIYENQTGVWDSVAARSSATLLAWAHVRPPVVSGTPVDDKYQRLPVIWGPSYAPGVSVSGAWGRLEYAAEVKGASLASRPAVWDDTDFRWRHPTLSSRIGFRPNLSWNLGASVSRGSYLAPAAAGTLPGGLGLGDYQQIVLGQDVSFAWHHLQLWAEVVEARFEIPRVGDVDTRAYYLEARYKFTPRISGAVRWNEQVYGTLPDGAGGRAPSGADSWRLDFAPTFRWSAHVQWKWQYSLEHTALRADAWSRLIATQVVVRF